ncbi:capsid protein [Capybara virus 4_cap1_390]|nr:capsid protein [Capybara virus 4_cap1_390]
MAFTRGKTGTLSMRRKRRTFRVRRSRTRGTKRRAAGMARVARMEVMKLSETKRYSVLNEGANPVGTGVQWTQCKNITAALVQGSAARNVEGQDISDILCKFKFRATYFADDALLAYSEIPQIRYNIAIIATNDQVDGSSTWVPAPTSWFLQQSAYSETYNGNQVTIIRKKVMTYKPTLMTTQTAGTPTNPVVGWGTRMMSASIKAKLRGKKKFETIPSSTTFLKGYNYYVVVNCGILASTNVTGNTGPPLLCDSYVYFKDF